MDTAWTERIDAYWKTAAGKSPEQLRKELEILLQGLDPAAPEVLFEVASLHDYLGEEELAVAPYEKALDAGLPGNKREEALLQLASTVRNLGDYEKSISLLTQIPAQSPISTDAQAFLVLALHDAGRSTEAVQLAVRGLAQHSSIYRGAIESYADLLTTPITNTAA